MSYFFSRLLSPLPLKQAHHTAIGLIGSVSVLLLPSLVIAQDAVPPDAASSTAVPTARYANGEDVDLSEIISEWRGYYEDVPVYLCICQDGTCDQSEQWPYREYDRYQLGVALGPTNGQVAEAAGSNCFDIADGSRPSNPRDFSTAQVGEDQATPSAPPAANRPTTTSPSTPDSSVAAPVTAPVRPPVATAPPSTTDTPSVVPVATVINDGADIRLDWPSGSTNTVNVTGSNWNINILDALDCESLSVVDEKMMSAQKVLGAPVVDDRTGNVAVPVLLDSCVEVDQMAVFILDPAEGGGYALYRTQLPAVQGALRSDDRGFPNEFSSYAYSTILEMRYWDSTLLVRQGSAAGTEAISIFRPSQTPAGQYAGCGIVTDGEGASALCD